MSLVDLVHEVEDLLPTKVHDVLFEIAKEVEAHKSLLSDLGALGGTAGEAVATGVEDASADIEKGQAATPAPTETSTDGGAEKLQQLFPPTDNSSASHADSKESATDTSKDAPTEQESEEVGNPEQNLPFEQWPKDAA